MRDFEDDEYAEWKACIHGHARTCFETIPMTLLDRSGLAERACECSWSIELRRLREPRLDEALEGYTDEAYRFLWLRSFDPALSIRVQRTRRRDSIVVKMLSHPMSDEPPTLRHSREDELAVTRWEEFIRLLEAADFWTTSRHARDGITYLDGASWILEGIRHGSHHLVYRHSPDPGPFRTACTFLIDQAGIDVTLDRVY